MNYQIEPCHINKITIYENVNYSPPPYLILKTSKQTLCLFCWKTFYKDSISYFTVFGNIKKNGQQITHIKIRLIFYRLFSKKKKIGKQSLSHTVHSSYKYYLLLT